MLNFREASRKLEGPFTVTKKTLKIISITDGTNSKDLYITPILPIAPYANNTDLKHEMDTIQTPNNTSYIYPTLLTEVFLKPDLR